MSIPTKPDTTPTALYNPLLEDFIWDYLDDNNELHQAVMPFGKITVFPKWMADVLKVQLATKIYNERGYGKTPFEDMQKIIKEEIEVEI